MSDLMESDSTRESRSWRVRGMDCASCVARIENAAARIPGVRDVSVNLMTETLTACLARDAGPVALVHAMESLG